MPEQLPLSLGGMVTLAGIWEVTAPKPGNVYRGADFVDMSYADFLLASTAIGQSVDSWLAQQGAQEGDAPEAGHVGKLVLATAEAMQQSVGVNTHLGTLLLLGPLVLAANKGASFRKKAGAIAVETNMLDAEYAYQAIQLAKPGGMGQADEADVREAPTLSLYEAMKLAADRDLVARQYTNGFAEVFGAADQIASQLKQEDSLSEAIVHTFLRLLSEHGDTLVARKCGAPASQEIADRAATLLNSNDWREGVVDLDFWLRSDGHRRNPGTTADLIGAALFVLLAEQRITWPVRFY